MIFPVKGIKLKRASAKNGGPNILSATFTSTDKSVSVVIYNTLGEPASEAHHFFKFHRLSAAYFNFFASTHFQQQAPIEIGVYFFYHA